MKNILFIHSSADMYGSDRSLYNLINNLDKNKYKISVLVPCKGPLVSELKQLQNVDVLIYDFAVLRRKYLTFSGIFKLIIDSVNSIVHINKLIKNKNIDIVYTNTSVVIVGSISAKIMRKKSIWHIREIISNKYEKNFVCFFVNKFSDVIIANSISTGKNITQKKGKLRVVYNAIDTSNIKIINKNEIENDLIVIGMAGRINRWKGQKLFVDMAEQVIKKTNNNIRFLIAGSAFQGEEYLEEDLKQYIKGKNLEAKINLLGQVNDMNEFYNAIDIFVLPSVKPEPFGLVILEAMARGIPVVATDHGGPTEIIDDSIDGFLVDYKSQLELSERVLKLIDDKCLREKIGNNGKLKQTNMFSIKNYTRDIDDILSNC